MAEEKKTEEKPTTESTTESTAVSTETQSTAVAVADEMSFEDELFADAGAGSEDIGLEHLTIPFFTILQPLSPEVQKGAPEYIKGAEAGMIMNTLTKELFKANAGEDGHHGILVSAVKFEPKAIEWKPRGQSGGGGLVRVWGDDNSYTNSPDYEYSKDKNRWISKEGNEVTDHYDTYIIQVGVFNETNELEMAMSQGILSCKGSQIKKAKGWNTERNMRRITVKGKSINPPSWYGTYRIQTRFEANDKGQWYGWEISPYKPVLELDGGRELYATGKTMYESLKAGDIRADEAGRNADAANVNAEPGTGDIPF